MPSLMQSLPSLYLLTPCPLQSMLWIFFFLHWTSRACLKCPSSLQTKTKEMRNFMLKWGESRYTVKRRLLTTNCIALVKYCCNFRIKICNHILLLLNLVVSFLDSTFYPIYKRSSNQCIYDRRDVVSMKTQNIPLLRW